MQEGWPPLVKSGAKGACVSGVSDKVVVAVVVVQGKIPDLALCVRQVVWVEGGRVERRRVAFFSLPHPSSSSRRNRIPALDDLENKTCLQPSVKFQMTLHCSAGADFGSYANGKKKILKRREVSLNPTKKYLGFSYMPN